MARFISVPKRNKEDVMFRKAYVLVKIAHLGDGVKELCFEEAPKLDEFLEKAEVDRDEAKSISINGRLVKKDENPQLKHNNIVVVVPEVVGG
jgi:hypothetical protein